MLCLEKKGAAGIHKSKFRPPNPPARLPHGLPSSLITSRAATANPPGVAGVARPSVSDSQPLWSLPASFTQTEARHGGQGRSQPRWGWHPPRSQVPLLRQAAATAWTGALPSNPSATAGPLPTAFRGRVSLRPSPPLNHPSPRTPTSPASLHSAIALLYPLSP